MFNTNPNCLELIKQGKCKADCCGCVPILQGYWNRLKKYAQKTDYKLFKFSHKGDKFIKAVTKDFKCVFLKKDFSCAIHHSPLRADVCKNYGLDKYEPLLACPHINEDKIDLIKKSEDEVMSKLVKMGDKCAKEVIERGKK